MNMLRVLLLDLTWSKIAQVLTLIEPAKAVFYFYPFASFG